MSVRAAIGLGVVLGALVGVVLPVPTAGTEVEERGAAPRPSSSASGTVAEKSVSPVPVPVCPQREDRESLDAEIASFEQAWGTPPDAPPGWDPVAREARLHAAIEALGERVLLSAVSCEIHPCVAVVVTREVFPQGELNEAFGVPVGRVGQAEAWNDDPPISLWTATIQDLSEPPDDEAEQRFSSRLASRLANELWPEVEALLEGKPVAP